MSERYLSIVGEGISTDPTDHPSEASLRAYAMAYRGKFYSLTPNGTLVQRNGCFKPRVAVHVGSTYTNFACVYEMMYATDTDLVVFVDADREADYE